MANQQSVSRYETSAPAVRVRILALIPLGVALNLVLGTVVHTLKLPIYCDAVGTIMVTVLAGLRAGVIVGVTSFLLGGLLVNPVLPWFSGTQACIAVYTHIAGRRGWFRFTFRDQEILTAPRRIVGAIRPILAGIGLGVVAAVVSAPVIVVVFGGVTGSGASLVVAFFLKSGETLAESVLWGGLSSEPIDKTLQVLISLALVRSLPDSLKLSFGGGTLARNNLLATHTR